ncbi:MAG TPA: complex I NDUFA9 subunit family protein [Steroidobacteraceae bacterium]
MSHTVCVLGGTGFIGRALVARLVADGHAVKVLTRDPARHREMLVLPTLRLVRADVHDPAVLGREFRGCDTVVNLVGILNERGFGGRGFRRVHTDLTGKVVTACKAAGVARYLHMSALNADAERGPSHYLRSKGAAEDLVRRECAAGPAYVIIRPSVVFGPGDSFVQRFARLARRMPGVFPLACANAKFAPVYVGDVVEAIVCCLDRKEVAGRSFELCGPEVLTLAEVVRRAVRTLGLTRRVIPLPRPISRLQAAIMDFVPGKPFSTDNYRSATVDSVCSRDGLGELGIAPTSMRAVLPLY